MNTKLIAMGLGAALAFTSAAVLPTAAYADLNIFACEPEWESLAKEIGGDKVTIYTATTAAQDPHRIQARPSLIARARAADLMVCTGAELEVGWLPQVIRQAANGKIQPGARGNFEAARYVPLRDIPTRIDRADGDVHAAGNPHIQTAPRNIAAVAQPLGRELISAEPESD